MPKTKLEKTIILDPKNKHEALGRLRRLVRTRADYPESSEARDLINNLILTTHRDAVRRGASEEAIRVTVSGLKER